MYPDPYGPGPWDPSEPWPGRVPPGRGKGVAIAGAALSALALLILLATAGVLVWVGSAVGDDCPEPCDGPAMVAGSALLVGGAGGAMVALVGTTLSGIGLAQTAPRTGAKHAAGVGLTLGIVALAAPFLGLAALIAAPSG